MALPLWLVEDLVALVGRDAVRAALDDDDDGTPDEAAVAQLQEDSDVFVLDMIRGTRADGVMDAIVANPPRSLKRLSLQWAMAQIWKRAPAHARGDWLELEKAARSELMDIRRSDMRIDINAGDLPPANVGGVVMDGSGDLLETSDATFLGGCRGGGFGDFA